MCTIFTQCLGFRWNNINTCLHLEWNVLVAQIVSAFQEEGDQGTDKRITCHSRKISFRATVS